MPEATGPSRDVRVHYLWIHDERTGFFEVSATRTVSIIDGYSTEADIPKILSIWHYGNNRQAALITVLEVTPL